MVQRWKKKKKQTKSQGFVKGEEFHWSYPLLLLKIIFCQTKAQMDILFNQSEASTSQLVSSLSVYESKQSLTACLLTFCNQ